MTKKQYQDCLRRLGLTPYGKPTLALLSCSVRQAARWASGEADVPPLVGKLLRLMVRHGVAPEDVG